MPNFQSMKKLSNSKNKQTSLAGQNYSAPFAAAFGLYSTSTSSSSTSSSSSSSSTSTSSSNSTNEKSNEDKYKEQFPNASWNEANILIKMFNEIESKIESLDEYNIILNMFKNQSNPFTETTLNSSPLSIFNKINKISSSNLLGCKGSSYFLKKPFETLVITGDLENLLKDYANMKGRAKAKLPASEGLSGTFSTSNAKTIITTENTNPLGIEISHVIYKYLIGVVSAGSVSLSLSNVYQKLVLIEKLSTQELNELSSNFISQDKTADILSDIDLAFGFCFNTLDKNLLTRYLSKQPEVQKEIFNLFIDLRKKIIELLEDKKKENIEESKTILKEILNSITNDIIVKEISQYIEQAKTIYNENTPMPLTFSESHYMSEAIGLMLGLQFLGTEVLTLGAETRLYLEKILPLVGFSSSVLSSLFIAQSHINPSGLWNMNPSSFDYFTRSFNAMSNLSDASSLGLYSFHLS